MGVLVRPAVDSAVIGNDRAGHQHWRPAPCCLLGVVHRHANGRWPGSPTRTRFYGIFNKLDEAGILTQEEVDKFAELGDR